MINFLVLATAQPMERTPNIAENEIKQNHDDEGTGDTSGTYSKQSYIIGILFYFSFELI